MQQASPGPPYSDDQTDREHVCCAPLWRACPQSCSGCPHWPRAMPTPSMQKKTKLHQKQNLCVQQIFLFKRGCPGAVLVSVTAKKLQHSTSTQGSKARRLLLILLQCHDHADAVNVAQRRRAHFGHPDVFCQAWKAWLFAVHRRGSALPALCSNGAHGRSRRR